MGKIRLTIVLSVAIVLAVVLLASSLNPSWINPQNNYLESSNLPVTPTVAAVVPEEFIANPETVSVNPVTIYSQPISADAKSFEHMKQAFGITPDQLTVTQTEWTVPTSSGDPRGITVDSSGNVWFTERGGDPRKVGRLIPSSNTFTEWSVKPGEVPGDSIAIDSLGNAYFAFAFGEDKIAKLDPSTNAITTWKIPTPSGGNNKIALDSSGNVWFIELSANKIGRLVPSTNTFTEWPVPRASALRHDVTAITIDSSDNVFFMGLEVQPDGNHLNKIDRLVPSTNTITEWKSSQIAGGGFMAKDPADNIFAAVSKGIHMLVPSTNTITTWSVGASVGIAVDSSGNVFFTGDVNAIGACNGKIDRLVPSPEANVLTEWLIPGASPCPHGIAADSSGNVFYTDRVRNQIGRLS